MLSGRPSRLQKAMASANAAVPQSRRFLLRIGINLGDVIGEGSDIYGEGVNIAARLEPLAEPGGIVISDKVEAEVRGKLAASFQDIGEQHLKNIARPVKAYSLGEVGAPRPPRMVEQIPVRRPQDHSSEQAGPSRTKHCRFMPSSSMTIRKTSLA